MVQRSRKITALEVGKLSKPGKHPIGDNLYLQISNQGTKSWLFRFRMNDKTTWMGLGSVKIVSLADARAKALQHLQTISEGINPLVAKQTAQQNQILQESKRMTFDECANLYIESHSKSWKNEKHQAQWRSTLETYASPAIGKLPIESITTGLVLRVLEPIWYSKSETASRVRGRVERILSWATVRGLRSGENPARWRGHLDEMLPKRTEVQKVTHFKALPYPHIYEFMKSLQAKQGVSIRALEFAILTCTRTNETLGAKWSEINLEEKYWMIPVERMKAKRAHKVPLCDRACEIIREMNEFSQSDFVFPGDRVGKPLSNMALLEIVRGMNFDITVHGFRSTFQDWAAEKTTYSQEVIDMALAHIVKGKTERAYRRGDLFEKRQRLMSDWSRYCSEPIRTSTSVVDITARLA